MLFGDLWGFFFWGGRCFGLVFLLVFRPFDGFGKIHLP